MINNNEEWVILVKPFVQVTVSSQSSLRFYTLPTYLEHRCRNNSKNRLACIGFIGEQPMHRIVKIGHLLNMFNKLRSESQVMRHLPRLFQSD